MGDVGDKLPALLLGLLQGVRHGVEGVDELAGLVVPARVVDPGVKVAVREAPGRGGHIPDGLGLLHGGGGGGHKGDEEHGDGGHAEDAHESAPHLRHGVGLGHGHDGTHHGAALGLAGGKGHHEAGLLVDAQVRDPGVDLPADQTAVDLLRQGELQGLQGLICGDELIQAGEDDDEVGAAHLLGHGEDVLHLPAGLVPGVEEGGIVIGSHRQLRNGLHLVLQLAPLLTHDIAVCEGEEGGPQQHQGQGHHAHGDRKGAPIDAFESAHRGSFLIGWLPAGGPGGCGAFGRSAYFPATSNLYPTPQTVFRAHWGDTFSTFSRSRLI